MATAELPPDADAQFAGRLLAVGARIEDVEESFVRSGGHGGQNVNKTSTCVMLVHRPTGVMVKCQTTRHQGRNREIARELLLRKLEERRASRRAEERSRVEKLRRQKRPRSRASKRRMLEGKSIRSTKKRLRRSVRDD